MPLFLNSDLLPVDRQGRPLRLPAVLPHDLRIYHEFRDNEGGIKSRVPEVVWTSLGTVAEGFDMSRPDLARELTFCHLYGRYDLMYMKMHHEGLYYRPELVESLELESESLRSYSVLKEVGEPMGKIERPMKLLGKADKELVLAMPKRMERDIKKLARLIDRTPGRTLRAILIRELFGRRFSVEKPLTPEEPEFVDL